MDTSTVSADSKADKTTTLITIDPAAHAIAAKIVEKLFEKYDGYKCDFEDTKPHGVIVCTCPFCGAKPTGFNPDGRWFDGSGPTPPVFCLNSYLFICMKCGSHGYSLLAAAGRLRVKGDDGKVIKTWRNEAMPGTLDDLEQASHSIRHNIGSITEAVFEIGLELSEVKDRLPHGVFGRFLAEEFRWSHDTANRYMRVSNRLEEHSGIFRARSEFGLRWLGLLSAKSTPDSAVDEVVASVKAGGGPTTKELKKIISQHKGETTERVEAAAKKKEAAESRRQDQIAKREAKETARRQPPEKLAVFPEDTDDDQVVENAGGFRCRLCGGTEVSGGGVDCPKCREPTSPERKNEELTAAQEVASSIKRVRDYIVGAARKLPAKHLDTIVGELRKIADDLPGLIQKV